MTTSGLVTVGRAYSGSTAAQVMAMLESAGVAVSTHPWQMQAIRWDLTHALGGIEIQVPVSQVERAAAILADVEITSRPKNRLLMLLVGVIVLAWVGVPPPASGFFAVFRRPAIASTAAGEVIP